MLENDLRLNFIIQNLFHTKIIKTIHPTKHTRNVNSIRRMFNILFLHIFPMMRHIFPYIYFHKTSNNNNGLHSTATFINPSSRTTLQKIACLFPNAQPLRHMRFISDISPWVIHISYTFLSQIS